MGDCNVGTWQIGFVLLVCRNCGVHEQCWIGMVCWSLSYVVNFIAAEHGKYGLSLCGRLWSEQS